MHRSKVTLNSGQTAEIIINLDLVRAIRPHAPSASRVLIEFTPHETLILEESFASLWNRIQETSAAEGTGTIREHRASP